MWLQSPQEKQGMKKWGPNEHAAPCTLSSNGWNRACEYGHQQPSTPMSLGMQQAEEMMHAPDSVWDDIDGNTDYDKTPRTPTNSSINSEEQLAEPTLEEWIAAITEAAKGNLDKVDPECRQDYIKSATWEKTWKGMQKKQGRPGE